MELYKIVFAEFERFKGDEKYLSYSFGTTNRLYKTKEECLVAMDNEYDYIKNRVGYENVEVEDVNSGYEFKLKCTVKDARKEIIHHYRMVGFSI